MEVYIPASSPLITYHPCRWCAEGWSNGDIVTNLNGTDPGYITNAQQTSVSLNFTGTGVYFDMAFSTPPSVGGRGGGASADVNSQWKIGIKVNGTDIPPTAEKTPEGVISLPDGMHHIELFLNRTDDGEASARVKGVKGVLSFMNTTQTTNVTVDDTQWASGQVLLSPGWNMLESNHSNYINADEYNAELPNADRFFNKSISWTRENGANTTIRFNGSTVWVFGEGGDEGGQFEVFLDNVSQGTYDSSGGPRVFNQVLYHTSALTDGEHTLSLVNRGGRLSFDRLVSSRNMIAAKDMPTTSAWTKAPATSTSASTSPITFDPPVYVPTPAPSSVSAAKDKDGDNTKVIVGASVGGVIGLILLTFLFFGLWMWCSRRAERRKRHRGGMGNEKGWKFVDLPGSESGHGDQTSSFGSSHATLATPLPIHTRRSLLPFKNNLWAKEKQTSDAPIPIRQMDGRPMSCSSPDPMLAALGGVNSPLTQLQRSCSVEPQVTPPLNINSTNARPTDHYYNGGKAPNATTTNNDDELLVFDDMPQVGTREWYHVFGLSPGNDKQQRRSSRASGFSNIFRRSAASSAKSAYSASVAGAPAPIDTAGHNYGANLDPREVIATGAEERSPRRRFFGRDARGNGNQVDSVWARF